MNLYDFLLEKSRHLNKDFIVGEKQLSFQSLEKLVDKLSIYLLNNYGINKQIGLICDNSIYYIIAYLSIIKSNNIVVLMETRISENDFKDIINSSKLSGFIINDELINKFKINKFKINSISSIKEICTNDQKINEELNYNKSKDNDLAVIIFTSGTSGKKKGVMLTHNNIISNTNSIIEYLKLHEKDRVLVILPFFYVFGASLLHTQLRVGGSIVLNKGFFFNCLKNIENFECTIFAGVPSTYQLLIKKTDFLKRRLPTLNKLLQAGGDLPKKYIKLIDETFKDKEFYVMYGATEASARLSYLPPYLINKKLGSIGKGIPGVKLEVLDEKGEFVLPGKVGEIVAQGKNIMLGYYNDPILTNKVLKNHKYYTGDLATIDQEGFIYVVGRKSSIIKSAGYRISPNEIMDIINEIEQVNNCLVFGVNDDELGETIMAVIETNEKNKEFQEKIKLFCNKKLPSYKIPKYIRFIESFPLNSSNKIDVRKIKSIFKV